MSAERTTASRVTIEVEGHVADVRLTRADKRNELDRRMFAALNESIDALRADPDLRAVVLSGEGPSFCAGLDVASFAADGQGVDETGFEVGGEEIANSYQRVAYGWRQLDVPVIAALTGACFGGGLQIALGADLRIAAPDTVMSVMENEYGLVPDMSLTQTLPRLVRDDVARDLVFSGRRVGAAEALELGLVTRIADEPLAEAQAMASAVAARSPAAIRRAKRLLNEAPTLAPAGALALEAELQRELLARAGQPGPDGIDGTIRLMSTAERPRDAATHEVANQAPPYEAAGHNTFSGDRVLVEALRREGGDWAEERAVEVGAFAGSAQALRWGAEANENPPKLRTHDRVGNRIDEVEFHPAWHELLGAAVGFGLHALPWREPQPGAHVARAAMFVAFSQAEAGVGCPISMTYSGIPALRRQPEVAAEWEPRLDVARVRRPRPAPGARQGGGALRHGDDREAGRLGRPREHDGGDAAQRRRPGSRVRADRPQVVHVGADVRRVPRPRAGRGRALVLSHAPLHAGRRAQPDSDPAAQGQARQPLERVERGRVRRRLGADGRRGGARRADDHRDGQPHPPRLHARRRVGHARRGRQRDPPHRRPRRLRQAADRPAADAKRARRPCGRVGGSHDRARSAWRAPTTRRRPATSRPSS